MTKSEHKREAAERNGDAPDPEVADKATRRRFTAAYKRRIVREADKCTKPGELGALLRREGVYSSSLSPWRRQRDAGELSGTGRKRGPKMQPKDARDKRIAQLERERRRLERKLEQAETVIAIQRKVASLLGIPLRSPDDEENSCRRRSIPGAPAMSSNGAGMLWIARVARTPNVSSTHPERSLDRRRRSGSTRP